MTAPQNADTGLLPGYKWSKETHDALLQGMPGGGIDRVTQLTDGNKNLVDQPGLVFALTTGQASEADAQSINHFLGGLQAERQVNYLRSTGHKADFSADQLSA